jgi:streptogramin lyase
MRRRDFLALAAALPLRRAAKPEIVYKSPGPHPNGLQATADGLWIMDQGNNRVYLVRYEDGKVLREFATQADRASGITFDGEALWLASTYNRLIIRASATTGATLSEYYTPGAGVIYRMLGDPPARSSPLAEKKPSVASTDRWPARSPGTGAHGLEWRDGRLWMAAPPSRTVYRIDPANWIVEQKFATAANRPHGMGWEGKYLWLTDSNLNAFFKHDPATGEMVEKIQLADTDPLPHGMTIWNGMMWYCDDVGVICRLKI